MIRDLSQILKRILEESAASATTQLVELAEALISFERPAESFNPSQTTISLFLYDIREAIDLRDAEPVIERVEGRVVVRQSPIRLGCTYLVTAWPIGDAETVLQEHRLLSQVLQVFSAYPIIPARFLEGTRLEGQEPPLPLMLHRSDDVKTPADFWTAMGNKLRPSLTVTAVLSVPPFEPEAPVSLPIVKTKVLKLAQRSAPEDQEVSFQIQGRVMRQEADTTVPVAAATVTLVERELTKTTNDNGVYSFAQLSEGRYTLRADIVNPTTGEIDATGEIALDLTDSPIPTANQYDVLVSSST